MHNSRNVKIYILLQNILLKWILNLNIFIVLLCIMY